MNTQQFLKDRREALLSMDKEKLLAYAKKYEVKSIPSDDEIFWIGIHKARTACVDLPMEERSKSKQWLTNLGFRSLDDGDVP